MNKLGLQLNYHIKCQAGTRTTSDGPSSPALPAVSLALCSDMMTCRVLADQYTLVRNNRKAAKSQGATGEACVHQLTASS